MSKDPSNSNGDKKNGNVKNGNDQDEIASYAESTIKEMLGWYGLHDQPVDGAPAARITPPGDAKRRQNGDSVCPVEGATTNGWDYNLTRPIHDTTEIHSPTNQTSPEATDFHHPGHPSPISAGVGHPLNAHHPSVGDSSGRGRHANRKLVGMRYLFPALGEDLRLYDRAHIWVARHDHKYFIGYTAAQLEQVDARLRPLAPITPELYKLHMNRSEYCRNVKLKYCLESEDDWAQEFRDKLNKAPNLGGFSGLCQVKIAAAELWRRYSENYKGHQARYPNPKSKFKTRQGSNSDEIECFEGGNDNTGNNDDSQDLEDQGQRKVGPDTETGQNTNDLFVENNIIDQKPYSNSVEAKADSEPGDNEMVAVPPGNNGYHHDPGPPNNMGVLCTEESSAGRTGEYQDSAKDMTDRASHSSTMVSTETQPSSNCTISSNGRGRSESTVSTLSSESETITKSLGSQGSNYPTQVGKDVLPISQAHSPGRRPNNTEMPTSHDDSELLKSESRLSPGFPQRERSQSCIEIGRGLAGHQLNLPVTHPGSIPVSLGTGGMVPHMSSMMLQQGGVLIPTMVQAYAGIHDLYTSSGINFPHRSGPISTPGTPISSGASTPTPVEPGNNKKPLVFRSSDYKKSERGLSFLFPSLADQQLSLLDKVRITVLRHKHNYFLGWREEVLTQLDPLVRPKMMVTRQLYKEYCHRNAMKYDSNLQFATESSEPWADEFRARLTKPPSEGGFHSLCEVKQEAGRLWREYSGRYKMHNVVKSQMDLNSEVSSIYLEGDLKEDFSSRAKQKMGESGDILTDPTTRARPRAISDLTDDRSMRYRTAYMQGAAAAHMMDFSPDSLTSTMPSGSDFQHSRSPLNVSVGEEPCNISRRSSYVTSEESISQGRSANSTPSPSSRSAVSSPGPQPLPFITTVELGSRSANSSPLNVHTSLPSTLTSSSIRTPHTSHITAAKETLLPTAGADNCFRLEHHGNHKINRKRSFETSSGAHLDGDSRADSLSPTIKASRISLDSSDSRSLKDIDSISDISTSFDKLSRKRSSGTSIESSKSEYDIIGYARDQDIQSRSPIDRLTRKQEFDQQWDDDLANTHTLFKPLPAKCCVSEQLGIWMQRHRHNYFRNYDSDDMLQVQPRVRPQYLVSSEIYRRFISENMVSMFGKVNEILESDTPWAKAYQTRVDQVPTDGGFSTIEEALTEALDLWEKYVEGGKEKQKQEVSGIPPGWKHKREKAMERTSTPEALSDRSAITNPEMANDEPLDEGVARERSSSWPQDPQFAQRVHHRHSHSKVRVLPVAWPGPLYAAASNLGSVGFLPTVGEFKVKQETPCETDDPGYADPPGFAWTPYHSSAGTGWHPSKCRDDNGIASSSQMHTSARHYGVSAREPIDQSRVEVLDLRRSPVQSMDVVPSSTSLAQPQPSDLQIGSAAQLSRQLWGCRAMLQKMLSEDPALSWHARLAPHLPRLRAQLGSNYTNPTSTASCMIDLLLATLDQQLSKL